jgi:uncharacterized GH25 family protein
MKHTLSLVALFCLISLSTFGHAIWIETNSTGSIGKPQEVKIYYGEYAAREFEKTGKWYSDVNTFILWLVSPDGSKKQLTYKQDSDSSWYQTSFTPDKTGIYTLTIKHSAREVDGTMVYQFNGSAVVTVGASSPASANAIGNNELYLQPVASTSKKKGAVKAFYKGKPAGKITITVSAPSGWSKSFETDENGEVKFELLWTGWYALEGFYTVSESGNHFDKPYDQIWRCATLRLNL